MRSTLYVYERDFPFRTPIWNTVRGSTSIANVIEAMNVERMMKRDCCATSGLEEKVGPFLTLDRASEEYKVFREEFQLGLRYLKMFYFLQRYHSTRWCRHYLNACGILLGFSRVFSHLEGLFCLMISI